MKHITINEVEYEVKVNLDDLTVQEYLELRKCLSEREYTYKEFKSARLGVKKKEKTVVPYGQESEEFKLKRIIDSMRILSNIPHDYYTEYPDLCYIVQNLVDWSSLIKIKPSKIIKKIDFDGDLFTYIEPTNLIFQQWCDLENLSKLHGDIMYFVILYKFKNFKYTQYNPHLNAQIMMFNSLSASKYIPCLNAIIQQINHAKQQYQYIYNTEELDSEDDSDAQKTNIQTHNELWGWEETICILADKNVFNSSRGTLHAVRNANARDVLEYLNITYSREKAKYEDEKQRQLKIKNKSKKH